jgi:ribosomal protein L29
MEIKELKVKSLMELQKLLAKERENLRAGRFSVSAKQLKDIRSIRKIKRLIAQILTIINQKAGEGKTNKEESINFNQPESENN